VSQAPTAVVQQGTTGRLAPGPNNSIWSNGPMLGQVPGASYVGRVVVESWDDGSQSVVIGQAGKLVQPAMVALSNPPRSLAASPWPNRAVTAEVAGKPFVGRVVVEVWDAQARVAVAGRQDEAINRAIKHLGDLREL
jgi:hypothetical protein